jgi:hypothetical protein
MTEEVQYDRSSRESQRSHCQIVPQLQHSAAFWLKQADMRIYNAQNCSDHCRARDLLLFWNPQRQRSERKAPKWGLAFGSLAGLLKDIAALHSDSFHESYRNTLLEDRLPPVGEGVVIRLKS